MQLLVKYEVVQWVSYFLNEMDYLGYDLDRDILEQYLAMKMVLKTMKKYENVDFDDD